MSTTYSQAWTVNDRKCVIPHPRKYPAAAGKANSITCPIGQPAGRAWVLMLKKDLDALLDENKDNPLATYTVRVRSQAQGARASAYAGELNWRGHFIGATPATWENYNQDESVFVVEFADRRWRARQAMIHKDYNLSLPYARPSTQGHPHTWANGHRQLYRLSLKGDDITEEGVLWTLQEIVADIWDNYLAPFLGTSVPTVKYDDTSPSVRNALDFSFRDVSAWDALCEVLFGFRMQVIVYDPYDDEFRIVSLMDNHAGDLMTEIVTSPPKALGEFPTGLEVAEERHGRPLSDMSRYNSANDPLSSKLWTHRPVLYPFGTEDQYSRIYGWHDLNWDRSLMEIDGLPAAIDGEHHLADYIPRRGAEGQKAFSGIADSQIEGDWPYFIDESSPPPNKTGAADAFHGIAEWLILNHLVIVGAPHSSGTTEDGYFKRNITYHGRIPKIFRTYAGIADSFRPGPLVKLLVWHDYGGGGGGLSTDVHVRPGLPTDSRSGDRGSGRSSDQPIAGWTTKAGLQSSHRRKYEMQSMQRPDVAQLVMIDTSDDDAEVVLPRAAIGSTGALATPLVTLGRTIRMIQVGTGGFSEQHQWQPLARCAIVDIRSVNTLAGDKDFGYPLVKGKLYIGKCIGILPVHHKDRKGNPTTITYLPTFAVDSGIPNIITGRINPNVIEVDDETKSIWFNGLDGPNCDFEIFGADRTEGEIDIAVGGSWMAYVWAYIQATGTNASEDTCSVRLRRIALGGSSEGQQINLPGTLGNFDNSSSVLATASAYKQDADIDPVWVPAFGAGGGHLTRGDRLQFEVIGTGVIRAARFMLIEMGNGASIDNWPRSSTVWGSGTPIDGVHVPPWGPPY